MRIARVQFEGQVRSAIVDPDGSSVEVLAPGVEVLDLLASDSWQTRSASATVDIAQVRLLAPIQPPTIRDFSVFEAHIEGVVKNASPEARVPDVWYASPFCYFSNPHAVNGPDDEIEVPPGCTELDLELEVAVVIGRAGKDLSPEQAGAHIAGYTIFNDWSARDHQRHELSLGLGFCKAKDFANTLGPWIVTSDELERHRCADRLDLQMRAYINGRELGGDTLASMAWSFEELVSYASRGAWVRPGDVLGSGTCGGGCLLELWGRRGRNDLGPLTPGDSVRLEVEGIGFLRNTIVAGSQPIDLPRAQPRRIGQTT